MAHSSLSLIKLITENVATFLLDYQHKFNNSMNSINGVLLELKPKFIKNRA